MSDLHGFELVRETYVTEIESTARLLRHRKTGAELLSLENGDDHKAFGITFRTPPPTQAASPISWNIQCCAGRANTR